MTGNLPFALPSDGSFMEMFAKMQQAAAGPPEAETRAQEEPPPPPPPSGGKGDAQAARESPQDGGGYSSGDFFAGINRTECPNGYNNAVAHHRFRFRSSQALQRTTVCCAHCSSCLKPVRLCCPQVEAAHSSSLPQQWQGPEPVPPLKQQAAPRIQQGHRQAHLLQRRLAQRGQQRAQVQGRAATVASARRQA
jgi:hypothetical protein